MAGMKTNEVYVDHITVLLSEEEFDTPPKWLTDNFNVLEGGDHTGMILEIPFWFTQLKRKQGNLAT